MSVLTAKEPIKKTRTALRLHSIHQLCMGASEAIENQANFLGTTGNVVAFLIGINDGQLVSSVVLVDGTSETGATHGLLIVMR